MDLHVPLDGIARTDEPDLSDIRLRDTNPDALTQTGPARKRAGPVCFHCESNLLVTQLQLPRNRVRLQKRLQRLLQRNLL